ncbi:MAG: hypothetical protein U0235_03175 [Polyangiaceae bacterium]
MSRATEANMLKRRSLVELASVSVMISAAVACSSEPPSSPPGAPSGGSEVNADTASNAKTLSSRLTATGFTVQEGRFSQLDMTACCATSCAGNNPSSPYFAFYVPPAPGGIPDPNPAPDGMSSAFRMDASEAIVFVGPTPPEVRYFGFTPYITDRATAGGGRRSVAASVSETLNDLVIRTAGASPFGQQTAVVVAMNEGARNAAINALVASGVPLSAINTLVFDPATVIPGLDANGDTLSVLFRVAVPSSKDALDAWLTNPGAHVYRMTPTAPLNNTTPLKVQSRLKNRSNTETALTSAVDRLRAAIVAQYPGYVAQDLSVDDGVPDPSACIAGTAICAFDNRDTTYPAISPRVLFQSDDDFYVAYGVDHQVSGKVSYANVSVYAMEHLVGLESVASPAYPGSAQKLLGDGDPDAPKLYAWKIARSCGSDPYCMTVDKGACPTGMENGKLGSIAFRTYLEPSSKTAPLPSTLVRDRVIRFRRP